MNVRAKNVAPVVKPARILIIDDDPLIREVLCRLLKQQGHQTIAAADGRTGLKLLQSGVDLLYLDYNLPHLDGLEITRIIREHEEWAELPIIMITGQHDHSVLIRALKAGATDFLTKPFDSEELELRTDTLLRQKQTRDALTRRQTHLLALVEQRSRAMNHLVREVERQRDVANAASIDTLERLALAAEFKDQDTASHIRRVGKFCELLAQRCGCNRQDVELARLAGPLHDVGKLGVPDDILMKPGPLTDEERQIMQRHSEIGATLLQGSQHQVLKVAEQIALTHHEWWDGSGYPHGLRGEEIPLFGRIAAVADVFDALTCVRPYKRAFSNDEAFGIMRKGRGTQFEITLLDTFVAARRQIEQIQKREQEQEQEQASRHRSSRLACKSHSLNSVWPVLSREAPCEPGTRIRPG